jgi:hypothetical protein
MDVANKHRQTKLTIHKNKKLKPHLLYRRSAMGHPPHLAQLNPESNII